MRRQDLSSVGGPPYLSSSDMASGAHMGGPEGAFFDPNLDPSFDGQFHSQFPNTGFGNGAVKQESRVKSERGGRQPQAQSQYDMQQLMQQQLLLQQQQQQMQSPPQFPQKGRSNKRSSSVKSEPGYPAGMTPQQQQQYQQQYQQQQYILQQQQLQQQQQIQMQQMQHHQMQLQQQMMLQQAQQDDEPELFGTIITEVIGLELFQTPTQRFEHVHLISAPLPADPHAVQVLNSLNQTIGYISPAATQAIYGLITSPHLETSFELKCTLPEAPTEEELPLRVQVDGKPSFKIHFQAFIQQFGGIIWVPADLAPQLAESFAAGDSSQMMYVGGNMKSKVELESDLDKLFDGTIADYASLDEMSPSSDIKTHMYPYQKQGLQWMYSREQRRELVTEQGTDWEKREVDGQTVYYNVATKATSKKPPIHARGGILADDMGLGKTLQMIGLVATCRGDEEDGDDSDDLSSEPSGDDEDDYSDDDNKKKTSKRRKGARKLTRCRATLIVCPLSVVSNWSEQLKAHLKPDTMDIYVYHGATRTKDLDFLAKQDIVITTYNILASEYDDPEQTAGTAEGGAGAVPGKQSKDDDDDDDDDESSSSSSSVTQGTGNKLIINFKREDASPATKSGDGAPKKRKRLGGPAKDSPLFKCRWFRVVLDEAHNIRDRRTRQSKAANGLRAERRWCVTGTPFQNKINDAYALLSFLRVEPFTSYQLWTKMIAKPLKNGESKAFERLKMVLASVCLRRRKTDKIGGKKILHLPPKREEVIKVTLTGKEKAIYQHLSNSGKKQFQKLMESNKVMQHYAFVLEMLLRMRQACNHSKLVPPKYAKGFLTLSQDRTEQIRRSLALLEDKLDEPCAQCNQMPDTPAITTCAHILCTACAETAKSEEKCPHCSEAISDNDVFTADMKSELAEEAEREELESVSEGDTHHSVKLELLVQRLKDFIEEDPDVKAVVFSQWTSFLDIVEETLRGAGMVTVRLDGNMTAQARQRAIQTFTENARIRVFLISLKAGGVGLNLTAANKVFLMDPWWNPGTEDQAVDRVYRLGQKKEVDIVKFIAKDTVEEKIVNMQMQKREMITKALGRYQKTQKEEKEDRLQDLVSLFN